MQFVLHSSKLSECRGELLAFINLMCVCVCMWLGGGGQWCLDSLTTITVFSISLNSPALIYMFCIENE